MFNPISYIGLRNFSNLVFWNDTRLFQEVEAPRLKDTRHLKVVRLSELHIGLYSQELFLVHISVES